MFENLSDRLGRVLKNLRGQGRITEDNVKDTLREVRMALLEADVALPVVRAFVDQVREKALGEEVMKSLTPGQVLIKIVNDELVAMMGEANEALNLAAQPPAIVLMAGLQGSGKTTSVAKLARFLKERARKSVMVTRTPVASPGITAPGPSWRQYDPEPPPQPKWGRSGSIHLRPEDDIERIHCNRSVAGTETPGRWRFLL